MDKLFDSTIPAVQHGNEVMTLRDCLAALKRSRQLRQIFFETFIEHFLVVKARELGMKVTELELQQSADQFRAQQNLDSTEKTVQWFTQQGITQTDFAIGLERDLVVEKLRETVAGSKVAEVFALQQERFRRVRLKRIMVPTQELAEMVIANIASKKSTFAEQAEKYSIDQTTRYQGGEAGIMRRVDFVPEVGEAVFSATPGQVIGPVPVGNGFLVLVASEFLRAEMDDQTRFGLRQEIFDHWVREQLSKYPLEMPLMTILE